METETVYSEKRRQHKSVMKGILFLFLGCVLLANNFDVLPWTVWETLWRLWPVLLIGFGIERFLGSSSKTHILMTILWIVVFGAICLYVVLSSNKNARDWVHQMMPSVPMNWFMQKSYPMNQHYRHPMYTPDDYSPHTFFDRGI